MARQQDYGSSIPTTFIWDIAQISTVDINSDAFRELLIRLYQNLNRMSLAINKKDTGLYPLQEFVTGKQFFINPLLSSLTPQDPVLRPVWRQTINFGALPNTGTKSVPHHIIMNPNITIVSIIAGASDTTGFNYIPIPYASPTLVNNIEINLDATNVNIITGSNRSNFNVCYVVIEFLKT